MLGDGRLFLRVNRASTVLDAATGEVVGSFASATPPAIDGDVGFGLYSITDSLPGTLTSFDVPTGDERWSQVGDGGLSTAPIVVGRTVVEGSATGMLFGYDESTGALLWSGDVGAGMSATNDLGRVAASGATAKDDRVFVVAGRRLAAVG